MTEDTLLANLASEFIARIRRGKDCDPKEYASRYPHLAKKILELFPTLAMLEKAAGTAENDGASKAGLSPGTVLGSYQILREIGRGGMGIVYEAVRTEDETHIALKVLPLQMPVEARRLERFFREARITADLNHPNIVPILDVGQINDTAYFAMRYIEGFGLDRIIKMLRKDSLSDEPPLSDTGSKSGTDLFIGNSIADETNSVSSTETRIYSEIPAGFKDYLNWVANLGIQAAAGLAYAHSRNLIHRDIKPSNLLLDTNGTLWIADFGLARKIEDPALTNTGVLLGTPRYMSPEQAQATMQKIDQRSDIYSLGATLYELITRRPVFEGNTPQEILLQILTREPVPPHRLDPSIPMDLGKVVMKAMAKNPDDRYRTADEFAEDLRHWLRMEPVSARRRFPVRHTLRWFRRNIKIAAVVFPLILALTIFGTLYYREKIRLQPEAATIDAGRKQSSSQNGASSANSDLNFPENSSLPSSFEGETLNWEANALRGNSTEVIAGGSRKYFPEEDILDQAHRDSDNNSTWWSKTLPLDDTFALTAAVRREPILKEFSLAIEMRDHPGKYTWERFILEVGSTFRLWTGKGRVSVILKKGIEDDVSYEELQAVEFLDDILLRYKEGSGNPTGSHTHEIIVKKGSVLRIAPYYETAGPERTLWWVYRDGREDKIPAPPAVYFFPKISPDGSKIAFTAQVNGNRDIWVLDLASGGTTRLTYHEQSDNHPIWSPDGKRIAYSSMGGHEKISNRDIAGIVWKAADGKGEIHFLAAKPEKLIFPYSWKGDTNVLITSETGPDFENFDIGMVSLEGEHPYTLLLKGKEHEVQPQLSPDGKWLAYCSLDESGDRQVFVRPFPDVDSEIWQISPDGGNSPRWAPNGKELFYLKGETTVEALITVEVQTEPTFQYGKPKILIRGEYLGSLPENDIPYDVYPDGQRFLMIKEQQTAEETNS